MHSKGFSFTVSCKAQLLCQEGTGSLGHLCPVQLGRRYIETSIPNIERVAQIFEMANLEALGRFQQRARCRGPIQSTDTLLEYRKGLEVALLRK